METLLQEILSFSNIFTPAPFLPLEDLLIIRAVYGNQTRACLRSGGPICAFSYTNTAIERTRIHLSVTVRLINYQLCYTISIAVFIHISLLTDSNMIRISLITIVGLKGFEPPQDSRLPHPKCGASQPVAPQSQPKLLLNSLAC